MNKIIRISATYHVVVDLWDFPGSVVDAITEIDGTLYNTKTEHFCPAYKGIEFETTSRKNALAIKRICDRIMKEERKE